MGLVVLLGMVYFYVLTYLTDYSIKELNIPIIVLHVLVTILSISLAYINPGILPKISEEYDSTSKI